MSNLPTYINRVRAKQPLVHNITNQVVINFTANGLYAIGAAPVMTNAIEETADMAGNADALLLNIGTLSSSQVEAMMLAGKAANKKGIPVVLDPVGAGATPFRTNAARKILDEVDVSIIRGNAGEIGSLAGLDLQVRGVDSEASNNVDELAIHAAKQLQVPVAVTGPSDIVTDGVTKFVLENGHPLLTKVTGTGCLLSSVIAAFLACGDDVLESAAAAIGFYGVTAEVAAVHNIGPGSFQVAFLDALHQVGEDTVKEKIKYEVRSIREEIK
ncbi:hydroxyethylthiazole kinase [Radiobacillus kanasensis]|uniref:hydroxyethylthiazole kinase n=1 Tax=Radiobacillus kanasensis TaxID=2844358 RepID=UPI001E44A441|nr:hydroxyethylthiazole kinase [Radiobacillus kanasensis]UFT98302.1 hydroxyethylthiazole kinase [Radiobacillus kanasensis]